MSLVPESGIVVVADGMGGHPGGDVASRIAVESATSSLSRGLAGVSPEADFTVAMRAVMEASVSGAHRDIRERGATDPELEGMGTTLTAVVADPHSGAFVIGHVGDSRAYGFADGRLTQLTRDDTWVQDRIDSGEIDPESARRSPYAHLLTQCLGLEEDPTAQLVVGVGRPGETLLLCTDGLVGMLDDAEMERILVERLGAPGTLADVVGALLSAANDAGGHDNVTAALVRFD